MSKQTKPKQAKQTYKLKCPDPECGADFEDRATVGDLEIGFDVECPDCGEWFECVYDPAGEPAVKLVAIEEDEDEEEEETADEDDEDPDEDDEEDDEEPDDA